MALGIVLDFEADYRRLVGLHQLKQLYLNSGNEPLVESTRVLIRAHEKAMCERFAVSQTETLYVVGQNLQRMIQIAE